MFEPKRVDSLLYTMIKMFNHGIQGTATWRQLSFVPRENKWADKWDDKWDEWIKLSLYLYKT